LDFPISEGGTAGANKPPAPAGRGEMKVREVGKKAGNALLHLVGTRCAVKRDLMKERNRVGWGKLDECKRLCYHNIFWCGQKNEVWMPIVFTPLSSDRCLCLLLPLQELQRKWDGGEVCEMRC